ncbi:unnamed protein product [Rhizoctonia solani]|uniref:Nephrocystin 3-like N-terminal domain-containing protein n=1 Tax=Rhizoctonia solani TaxID=456999 RepID=A0A8H2W6L6_9AGAM|nr:unnamed protein product [Rhizoctonia solani]
MSSPHDLGNRVRLRIAEIELQPALSKRTIKAELVVNGSVVKKLPAIDAGQSLKWSQLVICDAGSESRLELVIYQRHHGSYSRYESETCLVHEVKQSSKKLLIVKIEDIEYSAGLTLFDQTRAEESFAKGLGTLSRMEQTGGISDRLMVAQNMFKAMLQFGNLVAEAHPIAKLVFSVCTSAWERVEGEQKLGEELDDLAEQLVGMALLVEKVKKFARLEPLLQSIEDFLYLVEDVSIFVLERKAKGFVVRVLKGIVDSGDRDRVDDLGKRFQRVSGNFEKAIGAQTMAIVTTAYEDELLQRLDPVKPTRHKAPRACQDGTRLDVLHDIGKWIQAKCSSSTFMWVYGQAGIGKSTISTSVCKGMFDRGAHVVSFFCKRDDSELRDPLRLINSIAHGLACRYPPYGKLVAKAIETNKDLYAPYLDLETRYRWLLKNPLCELNNTPSPTPCVVIIDALDECGTEKSRVEREKSREQLLKYLVELSSLVTWLRVIVTSRPDSDIRDFFDKFVAQPLERIDLHKYPAVNDIRAFIEKTLGKIPSEDGWPVDGIDRLCKKAGDLFIWGATACAFITGADDSLEQLQLVLDGNSSASGFDGLDSLYMAVIRNALANDAADSLSNMKRCIGAVVTISTRQPVPIEALSKLMGQHIKPKILGKIISRLGAVLYSDAHLKGAIRVMHPSFADFVVDKGRSGDFWANPVQRNIEISAGCVHAMKNELRFNICELETSHLPNNEIPDLDSKIDANISGQLAYSCIYWIDHLLGSEDKFTEVAGLAAVVVQAEQPLLLYWLEVLSVLQKVHIAIYGLRELGRQLQLNQRASSQSVWDAFRFVFAFSDPIIISAPHIYISALALAPKQSKVSSRFLGQFLNTARVVEGEVETWPNWLRSLHHPSTIRSLCVSQDGQWLLTSCKDDSSPVRIFDMRTGELLRTLKHDYSSHVSRFVVISPDGSLIASASETGQVLFWNANTGIVTYKYQIEIPAYESFNPKAWSFSPDGSTLRMLVTTSDYYSLEPPAVWEIGRGKETKTPLQNPTGEKVDVTAAAPSPDGTRVAVGYSYGYDDLLIFQWSYPLVAHATRFNIGSSPKIIVFSPEGNLVATAGDEVQIWNVKTGKIVGGPLVGLGFYGINAIAFSSDGAQIVAGTWDCTVRTWETRTCNITGNIFLGHSLSVKTVGFSPDGLYILSGSSDNTVLIWDVSTGRSIDDDDDDNDNDNNDSFAEQLTGSIAATQFVQHEVSDCDVDHSEEPRNLEHSVQLAGHSDPVTKVMFSLDGNHIISVSNSHKGMMQNWDAQTGCPIGNPLIVDSPITRVGLSPDGTRTIVTGHSCMVDIRDTKTYELLMQHNGASFALSPDGTHLVTGDSNLDDDTKTGLFLRDFNTGCIVRKLDVDGVKAFPFFIAFASDGSQMLSCHRIWSDDGSTYSSRVIVWDVKNYSIVGDWSLDSNFDPQALSLDGSCLASYCTNDLSIVLNDSHTGKRITHPLVGHTSQVYSIAFSPDGIQMASGAREKDIRLWDAKRAIALINPLAGHTNDVHSVSFSPDGTKLVSGSEDESICVWDVSANGIHSPWHKGDSSRWPSNTRLFPPHPTRSGWVSHDQKALTIWLPDHYRNFSDHRLLQRISADPQIRIDFSRFVHGEAWTSVMTQALPNAIERPMPEFELKSLNL